MKWWRPDRSIGGMIVENPDGTFTITPPSWTGRRYTATATQRSRFYAWTIICQPVTLFVMLGVALAALHLQLLPGIEGVALLLFVILVILPVLREFVPRAIFNSAAVVEVPDDRRSFLDHWLGIEYLEKHLPKLILVPFLILFVVILILMLLLIFDNLVHGRLPDPFTMLTALISTLGATSNFRALRMKRRARKQAGR